MKKSLTTRVKTVFFALACLFLAWLFVGNARAGEVTLSWAAPDGGESCTPSTGPIEVDHYRIWLLVDETVGPVTSWSMSGLEPGEYTYTGQTVAVDGLQSRLAVEATKTVTSLTTIAGSQVFQPVSINNAFWLLPVGTARAGTECIVNQTTNGLYAIPNTEVDWSSGTSVRPLLVVTDCQ